MPSSGDGNVAPLSFRSLPSQRLFAQAIPDALFHYTTLEGAHGILTSKQIWLTKIQHLNDAAELRYALDLFRMRAQDWPGDLPRATRDFLLETAHRLGSFLNANICLASFCTEGDLLSQWRAYSAAANGVSLAFSGAFLRQLSQHEHFHIWKCLYRRDEHDQVIDDLIAMLLDACRTAGSRQSAEDLMLGFSTVFLQVAPVLKHPSFHEEKEWRIITAPVPAGAADYHVVLAGWRLRPTFRLRFPLAGDGSCRVVVGACTGPSTDAALMVDALTLLAGLHGHVGLEVRPSGIPYRAV